MMSTVSPEGKSGRPVGPVNPAVAISAAANVSTANICPFQREIIKAVRGERRFLPVKQGGVRSRRRFRRARRTRMINSAIGISR